MSTVTGFDPALVRDVDLLCLDAGNTVVFLDHERLARACVSEGFTTTPDALLKAEGDMKRALEQGDRIELRGFGVFNVKPRKTGIGRNPRTGAEVSIPPGKAVRFKPGKELQTLQ